MHCRVTDRCRVFLLQYQHRQIEGILLTLLQWIVGFKKNKPESFLF